MANRHDGEKDNKIFDLSEVRAAQQAKQEGQNRLIEAKIIEARIEAFLATGNTKTVGPEYLLGKLEMQMLPDTEDPQSHLATYNVYPEVVSYLAGVLDLSRKLNPSWQFSETTEQKGTIEQIRTLRLSNLFPKAIAQTEMSRQEKEEQDPDGLGLGIFLEPVGQPDQNVLPDNIVRLRRGQPKIAATMPQVRLQIHSINDTITAAEFSVERVVRSQYDPQGPLPFPSR